VLTRADSLLFFIKEPWDLLHPASQTDRPRFGLLTKMAGAPGKGAFRKGLQQSPRAGFSSPAGRRDCSVPPNVNGLESGPLNLPRWVPPPAGRENPRQSKL